MLIFSVRENLLNSTYTLYDSWVFSVLKVSSSLAINLSEPSSTFKSVTFNFETAFSAFLFSFKDYNKTIIACSFFCNHKLCAKYLICFSIHYKQYHFSTSVGLFSLPYLTTSATMKITKKRLITIQIEC